MNEELSRLYDLLNRILMSAPEEDECTDAENEAYADMANLKVSLEGLFEDKGIDPQEYLPWYEDAWYREDLEDALEEAGVPVTEDNIRVFLEKAKEIGIFDDKSSMNEALEDMAGQLFADQIKEGE